MATLYVSKSGNDSDDGSAGNPKLTINAALSAASNGDTINIGAGTYNESVKCQNGVSSYPIHFVGATGDPEDVIVTHASGGGGGHGTFSVTSGGTVSHITCIYTGTTNSISAASVSTPAPSGATWTNCIMKSTMLGIEVFGTGAVFDRCTIICTHEGTSNVTSGVEGIHGSTSVTTMKSCLVKNFNTDGIDLEGRGTVISCTVQTDYRKSAGRGIYADNVYNSIFHNNSDADLTVGIRGDTAVKNCISYGVQGDDDFTGTETDCYEYTEVTSSGFTLPFVNEGNDNFKITIGSRARTGGTLSTGSTAVLTDLVGRTISTSNPPIGCYVYAWAAGTSLGGVSDLKINKIAGASTEAVAKVMGV